LYSLHNLQNESQLRTIGSNDN